MSTPVHPTRDMSVHPTPSIGVDSRTHRSIRTRRQVLVVDLAGRVLGRNVRVAPAIGSPIGLHVVIGLCTAAAIEPSVVRDSCIVRLEQLPDLEALCEHRGVVVQRTRRLTDELTRSAR